MKNRVKHDKLEQALELLNEAAQEKKEELYDLIGGRYSHIKEVLNESAENGKTAIKHAKKTITKTLHDQQKKVRDIADDFDEKVHDNPWAVLGGVALAAFMVGFSVGHRK
ncbi:MAG: hypothetical protein HY585_00970 [Candidatus Omnitrophica bacterium]|nr:hypothetical protein [Candidatus Omnitrophota bacterium]